VTPPDETSAAPPGATRRRPLVAGLVLVAGAMLAVLATAGSSGRGADDGLPGSTADGGERTPAGTIAPTTSDTVEEPLFVPLESADAGAAEQRAPAPAETASEPTPPPTAPPQDADAPSVVARPVPSAAPDEAPPPAPAPPWAASVRATFGGHVSTDVGCVPSGSARPSSSELDAFFAERVGPVVGWDYQHVYPLGGDRYLWLFQDAFIDHSGGARTLGQSAFAHNVALVQEGGCFRLLHRGTPSRPEPFEPGTGSATRATWFWPMGGELHDGVLQVFWVQMVKDGYDPTPPDGLGWHPVGTWLATYDPGTLARLDLRPATDPGVTPIYGYAVASDDAYTYLFGNTFEQNLAREGGYWAQRHSATRIYLARVPRGQLTAMPEYLAADGWRADRGAAVPILDRHWAEFPLQPRFVDGQWVAVAAVDGYWGDALSVDVAPSPWGPWTTVESRPLAPRGADPLMNTYHAHLAPWREASGALVVTVSNNARDMARDAWPHPQRYRPMAFSAAWVAAPPAPPPATPPTAPSTTAPSTTALAVTPTVAPSTTRPPRPTTTTTSQPPTTVPPVSTTTTTVAPSSTSPPASTTDPPTSDAVAGAAD